MSHIVIKVYNFACDYPGCEEMTEVTGYSSLAEAREELTEDQHWRRVSAMDICPKH